jgi:hypothetical protein
MNVLEHIADIWHMDIWYSNGKSHTEEGFQNRDLKYDQAFIVPVSKSRKVKALRKF